MTQANQETQDCIHAFINMPGRTWDACAYESEDGTTHVLTVGMYATYWVDPLALPAAINNPTAAAVITALSNAGAINTTDRGVPADVIARATEDLGFTAGEQVVPTAEFAQGAMS